ncbi:hypothetical protein CLV58_13628 [Spirosoma oryzae]|uniref:Uncharacterized protein n=1 Tax=Spirosoma oryzae TaxID=1469603 RepID=A0A2T0RXY2_9BACT|nr:hypothetical protein CLV58_13628 [Spirosoma oryzae]
MLVSLVKATAWRKRKKNFVRQSLLVLLTTAVGTAAGAY